MQKLQLLLKKLRLLCLFAGFVFIAILLRSLFQSPEWLEAHVSLLGTSLAIMVGLLGNAVIGVTFAHLIGKTAPKSSQLSRIKAYYYTQIVKYVPGRIAALLAQKSLLEGNSTMSATIISNIELIGISAWLCSGAAISLLYFLHSVVISVTVAIVAVLGGAFLMRADWNSIIIRLFRHLSAKPFGLFPDNKPTPLPPFEALSLSAGLFLLPAFSIYLLVASGMRMDENAAIAFTALLLLSWVGGTLAFIFPAGIGIREFVFYSLGRSVTSMGDPEILAGVALMSRATQISIDLLGSAIFAAWFRLRKSSK